MRPTKENLLEASLLMPPLRWMVRGTSLVGTRRDLTVKLNFLEGVGRITWRGKLLEEITLRSSGNEVFEWLLTTREFLEDLSIDCYPLSNLKDQIAFVGCILLSLALGGLSTIVFWIP